MNFKQKVVRNNLIKLLKKTKQGKDKSYTDDEGNPITVEEFADILLNMKMADVKAMGEKIKAKGDDIK